MQRRHLLASAATLGLHATLPAHAQTGWAPTRPIEIVAHNGPGSGPDVFARALATTLETERLASVRLQVANRVGGGGATAMNYIIDKRGDPHVLGVWTSLWLSLPLVQAEARALPSDMAAVTRIAIEPALIVTRTESPHRTLGDFITAARACPGALRQSGGSPTARDNLVRQLLMASTGTRWAFVSFPGGGERVSAVLGGHVDIMIAEPSEAGEQVRAGRMRVLAQVGNARLPGFPEVPTLAEAGFTITDVVRARGLVAPPGIPAEAVAYYQTLFQRMSESAAWKKCLDENQFQGAWLSAADTATLFTEYQGTLRGILQEAGMRLVR